MYFSENDFQNKFIDIIFSYVPFTFSIFTKPRPKLLHTVVARCCALPGARFVPTIRPVPSPCYFHPLPPRVA